MSRKLARLSDLPEEVGQMIMRAPEDVGREFGGFTKWTGRRSCGPHSREAQNIASTAPSVFGF